MTKIRTVNLELLRHGPPHNQLLSPLTRYLALCGNHSPETVMVPVEHQQLLARLRTLRYQDSTDTLEMQLLETAQMMATILAGVPGLIAELRNDRDQDEEPELTQLRLIVSASELALLPFELANAPNGFPGSGQPLALQSSLPLSVTRQVRRVSNESFEWPIKPKVLFAAAAPPEVGSIPLESHLLALRRLLDPWVRYYETDEERRRAVEQFLVFLPRASVQSIEQACREHDFTHVHILAHGVPFRKAGDDRFGLGLHCSADPSRLDVVAGSRLATALRTFRSPDDRDLSRPAVVTIASCDSGAVGSVVGAGASIAHDLHEAGIPLVVASQFPLSFGGSVCLACSFYESLLWGIDPRIALSDLRRQLHILRPERHDWASVVAYSALPSDLPRQLAVQRVRIADLSIRTALDWADNLIKLHQESLVVDATLALEAADDSLQQALSKLQQGKRRLLQLADRDHRVLGLLASAEKREAQIFYEAANLVETRLSLKGAGNAEQETQVESYRRRSTEALEEAMSLYRKVFETDLSSSWATTQYISLGLVLNKSHQPFFDLWTLARLSAEIELSHADSQRVTWAHSTLAELYMLSVLLEGGTGLPDDPESACELAVAHAEAITRMAEKHPMDVYSVRRQFYRYGEWFQHVARWSKKAPEVISIADAVLATLPDIGPAADLLDP